ncbi:MAG TPA: antitoxin Xre/MbcA/ParS toxin-binding domain-containing protein [Cyclobacteriaceae bacterium]|nr:antitoxin Xre/MbcA/ParS toxin-binding domain-containing protein [Cyclobacteriaceae bacterium]
MARHDRIDTIQKLKEHPLKFSDLKRTANKFGLNQDQTSLLANISPRTLKSKSELTPLSFRLSEQILLLEELYQIGLDVFDSNEASFQDWLKTSIPALENHIPNDLLTSQLGIDVVKEELLRIEHGVY